MGPEPLLTLRLQLTPRSREEARRELELLPSEHRAQVSPKWLELLDRSEPCDPWIHGFQARKREDGKQVGQGGFTGPPNAEGRVEIAYGVEPEFQGLGYATEIAAALTSFAFTHPTVRTVLAHTLPEANASGRVLTKCGFVFMGEVTHPEDGLVWRWEKQRPV